MSGATQEPVSGRGAGARPDSFTSAESDDTTTLCREDAFEVLSNARRRHTIHYLLQQDDGVTLRDLSEQIAAWENDENVADVSSKQRKRVYTALRQSHLPKLDDKEIIEFDADRGTVDATDRLSDLRVYMEVVPDDEIPWSVYYLGIGGISLGMTLLTWLGFFPFEELPSHLLAFLISSLVFVSGLVHVYATRQSHIGSDGLPPEYRN